MDRIVWNFINNLKKIDVEEQFTVLKHSFGALPGMFFWNNPFNFTQDPKIKDDMINNSVFDFEYSSLREFIREAKKYLSKDRKIFLGNSNIARIKLLKQIAKAEK